MPDTPEGGSTDLTSKGEGITAAEGVVQLLDVMPEDVIVPKSKPEKKETPVDDEELVEDDATPDPDADKKDEDAKSEDEDLDEEQDAAPETRTVKIDGVDVEVTYDEALGGYLRTADYTRKTQDLARKREATETEAAGVRVARDQYADRLRQVDETLVELMPAEPDWNKVRAEQPDDFAQIHADWEILKERRGNIAAERERVYNEQVRERTERHGAYLVEEQGKLVEAIPDLKDAEKGPVVKEALLSYGEGLGFSRQEIAAVADHRAIRMLHKAMLYDRIQAKRAKVKGKADQDTTVLKPGSRSLSKGKGSAKVSKTVAAARERLASSGSPDDAAASILEMEDTIGEK